MSGVPQSKAGESQAWTAAGTNSNASTVMHLDREPYKAGHRTPLLLPRPSTETSLATRSHRSHRPAIPASRPSSIPIVPNHQPSSSDIANGAANDHQNAQGSRPLNATYGKSSWRRGGKPIIGSPDCPMLAGQYASRGRSCYQVFVYQKGDGTFGCRHKECFRDGTAGSQSSRFEAVDPAESHARG